jgi:hypothetical protein
MAMDYYIDVAGRRTLAKSPDQLPRIGETLLLTPYGRVRAHRHLVTRIEWAVAQDESPQYFNRPKQVVVFVEPEALTTEE